MPEGYPKTKYPKRGGGHVLVMSPEQEKGLGDNWQDFPPPAEVVEEQPKRKRKEEPLPPTTSSPAPSD